MLKEIGTSSQSDNLQLFSLQSQIPKQSVRRIICPAESSIMTTSSVCLFGIASQSDTLIRSPLAAMCTANLYGHLPSCVPALKKGSLCQSAALLSASVCTKALETEAQLVDVNGIIFT